MQAMNNRRKVLLVQLPIPPLGPQPIRGNVPLAAGYLKLYARQWGVEEFFDIEIMPASEANSLGDQALVAAICERAPLMIGFTCYLWSIDRTLWLAEQVKRRRPESLVIVGGPEITPDNDWVLDSPAIDYAVIGEGEQTFAELLAWYARDAGEGSRQLAVGSWQIVSPPTTAYCLLTTASRSDLISIAGLAHRINGQMIQNQPRRPMPNLDPISSPYLAGILNAGDQEQLLLETIRGCIFKCKFCYYPKAYDALYYVSREKILANLAHARENGAKEVYLLDPTLNQRRDFTEFLELLKSANTARQLEFYAELRAEGVTAQQAKLMHEANFVEVEIGLQSIDPATQELMERRNNLKAFEKGVRALQAEGVRAKVDLIVGLPGDTVDSVRRGMHYLAENRLYDEIQVFQLSILPGTSFRHEAIQLGLEFQSRPPYYVLRTPTLSLDDMLGLLEESEEIFQTEFDPLPPVSLDINHHQSLPAVYHFDFTENGTQSLCAPECVAQAFTLWFHTLDAYRDLPQMSDIVREFLSRNPFSTLQIVIETARQFPFDVFEGLRAAWDRPENVYLDRFYEFTPGRPAGARRIVTLLPARARQLIDPPWITDARDQTDLLWVEPSRNPTSSPPQRLHLVKAQEPLHVQEEV